MKNLRNISIEIRNAGVAFAAAAIILGKVFM